MNYCVEIICISRPCQEHDFAWISVSKHAGFVKCQDEKMYSACRLIVCIANVRHFMLYDMEKTKLIIGSLYIFCIITNTGSLLLPLAEIEHGRG